MPEGPELHLSSLFINRICKGRSFSGQVYRNPIHKCAEIVWNQPDYRISAESRGKELMLHLSSCIDSIKSKQRRKTTDNLEKQSSLSIRFTFGMSGMFEFTPANDLIKHSHLSFFTKDEPIMALSFVDPRRFGKWIVEKGWNPDRGPCVIQEYEKFVDNIFANVNHPAFKKPICEALLDQKFFSGIGNYLRAEILYRCGVPPFERASDVLQLKDGVDIKERSETIAENDDKSSVRSKKRSSKKGTQDPQKPKIELSEENGDDRTSSAYFVKSNSNSSEVKCEADAMQSLNNISQTSNTCKINLFNPKAQELLQLCNTVPLEVVKLGSTKYTLSDFYKMTEVDDGQSFFDWLQCYSQPGMKNMSDHNSRTIWFKGPPGPLVPKEKKSRSVKILKKSSKVVKEEKKETSETEVNTQELLDTEKVYQKKTITRKQLQRVRARESSGKKTKRTSKTEVDRSGSHDNGSDQKETITRKRVNMTKTREAGNEKKAKIETSASKKQMERRGAKKEQGSVDLKKTVSRKRR